MSDKAQKDLCDAIRASSIDGVKTALEAGADPSIICHEICNLYWTPLRFAILHTYFFYDCRLEILRLLANDKRATKEAIVDVKGYAERLKKRKDSGLEPSELDSMISVLDTASAKKLESTLLLSHQASNDSNNKDDSSFFKKYLFSTKHSDVQFTCNDGEIIHTHKIVLPENCPLYFDKAFSDQWKKNNKSNNDNSGGVIEFKPEASSRVMKVIIAFIYTSSLDLTKKLLVEDINHSFEILKKAEEYGLSGLKEYLEKYLKHSLSLSTFKETLLASD